MSQKSTVDEIRQRFDSETNLYSNVEIGQASAVDSPLAMSLVAEAASVTTPHAKHLLDVGCGGGNYTLKLLERMPGLNVTLIDLSRGMLDLAFSRIRPKTTGSIEAIQSDIREINLGQRRFDIVLASAVLHHLSSTFALFRVLKTGLRK